MPAGQADWSFIKRRWEEGLSAPAIEKEIVQEATGKPAVTRQAILKRANKEGWTRGVSSARAVVRDGSNVVSLVARSEPSELAASMAPLLAASLQAIGKDKATVEVVERGLQAYAAGGNHTMAAAMAGVSLDSWARWRDECPQLSAAIEAIHAAKAVKHLERIDTAGKRGDWKADEALLKANPLTRADWQQDKGGSSGVAIQINFGPAMSEKAMKVIDG